MANAPDVEGVQPDIKDAVRVEARDPPGFPNPKVLAFEIPARVGVSAVDRAGGEPGSEGKPQAGCDEGWQQAFTGHKIRKGWGRNVGAGAAFKLRRRGIFGRRKWAGCGLNKGFVIIFVFCSGLGPSVLPKAN